MLIHPQINPVALQLVPLAVHCYGLTYLAALGMFIWLGNLRLRHEPFASFKGNQAWHKRDVEDILFMGVMGVVLGGRLGYCLFYKPLYYAAHPLEVFAVWQGGMSFHGGMLGVILAMLWFGRSRGRPMLQVTDFVAPCVPTGLAAGRVGNFINGELWGRVAQPDLPWGMVFRGAGELPRHPSQVYQFLLEGLLLFADAEGRATKSFACPCVAPVPYIIEEITAGVISADNHQACVYRMSGVAAPCHHVLRDDNA